MYYLLIAILFLINDLTAMENLKPFQQEILNYINEPVPMMAEKLAADIKNNIDVFLSKANIFKIIMLAACADAFLDGNGSGIASFFFA